MGFRVNVAAMEELLRTNNPVTVSFAEALLSEKGIVHFVADLQNLPCISSRRDDFVALRHSQAQRFFTQNVLPGCQRCHRSFVVAIIRQRDDDCVDSFQLKDLTPVFTRLQLVPDDLDGCGAALFAAAADSNDSCVGKLHEVTQVSFPAKPASAQKSNVDCLHR